MSFRPDEASHRRAPGTVDSRAPTRRTVLIGMSAFAATQAFGRSAPALAAQIGAPARVIDIRVTEVPVAITGKPSVAVLMNGTLPGPVLRLREGDDLEIRVTNALSEDTSVHWHGLLLPPDMDGVPGISFPGIKPGETFVYRFRLRQSGTYWFHSHSGGQELVGMFGAMVIEPAVGERHRAERDYVVMLSDWHDTPPLKILANLKRDAGYYNYNKRTVTETMHEWFNAPGAEARAAIVRDRLAWGEMRMDPTDLADVTGYTFLMNGKTSAENWTALFHAGERVRLRFVNAAGMTLFDVKIPDLPMTVVQADGQDVEPVAVEEFRIAPGETYDIVVEPAGGRAYTIFAQSLDRSGYARGSIAAHEGMTAAIPALDPRPLRKLSDMGGAHAGHGEGQRAPAEGGHEGHATPAPAPLPAPIASDHQSHGAPKPNPHVGHAAPATSPKAVLPKLSYADLRAVSPDPDHRPPDREVVLRLTGVMERYIWTINDKKLFEAEPIRLRYGERVRITYVNETMMEHPLHLHGVFTGLQNGQGAYAPLKHTIIVDPGKSVSADFTANEPGAWALHCHLLLHMVVGMFVKVIIDEPPAASLSERTGR